MAHVILPNPLTDGTAAKGSEVRANDDAITAQLNGNVDDSNIKVGAAIDGNKLSNLAGFRVATDRIEDDAITSAKLDDDPAPGSPTAAVTADHIRGSAVTKEKIGASAVSLNKMDVLYQSVAFAINFSSANISTLLGVSMWLKTSGANYIAGVHGLGVDSGGSNSLAIGDVIPGTAIPTASRAIVAVYLDTVVLNTVPANDRIEGNVVFVSIARS